MKLFRFLSILLCGSLYFAAHAQQCGFEHDALFIVKLIEEESGAFQHNVKLSLVYGNNRAIEAHSNQDDQGVYCSEPYVFWENTTNKIPKQTCAYTHMVRTTFAGLGNAYLCVVPLESMNFNLATLLGFNRALFLSGNEEAETVFSKLKDSLFWHIRIEEQGNKLKRTKPTLIRIPLHTAINICKEHIAEGYSTNQNSISKRTIYILHTKQGQYQLLKTLPDYDYYIFAVRSKTFSDDIHPLQESSQGISRILVIHDSSGQVTQTIAPESDLVFFRSLEFVTWPVADLQDRRVFRIKKESSIQNEQTKPSTTYYSFNPRSKRYEPDEELNQMDSIKFNERNGRLIGFKNEGEVTNIYHYSDKTWVLQLSKKNTRSELDILSTNMTPIQKARLQCERSQRNLPIQSFSTITKTVLDTFWVKNSANAEATLKLYPSAYYSWMNAKNSNRSHSLKPNEQTAIIYERKFEQETKPTPNPSYVKQPLEFITDFCMIQYQEESITLSMSYPIIKEKTIKTIEDYGVTHYSYPYIYPPYPTPTNTTLAFHVLTDSNGYVLSYGKQLSNGTKIGPWVLTERSAQGDFKTNQVEQHAKLLTLYLNNDTLARCQIQVVSAWNSYTIEPDTNTAMISSQQTIMIPPGISYINIKKNNKEIEHKIQFDRLEEYGQLLLFLLEKNQPFYYSNGIKFPIQQTSETYYVVWNEDYIQSLKKRFNQTELLEQLGNRLEKLKKQFPKLSYTCDLRHKTNSKFEHQNNYLQTGNWILDLNECLPDECEAIKERITNATTIKCLSYVLNTNPTLFSDGSCSVTLSPLQPLLSKEFLNALDRSGFKLDPTISPGSNGTYYFTYVHPIIDVHFFETYNRLCEEFPTYQFSLLTRGYEHLVEPSEMPNFKVKE